MPLQDDFPNFCKLFARQQGSKGQDVHGAVAVAAGKPAPICTDGKRIDPGAVFNHAHQITARKIPQAERAGLV